jgi:hypothetical protein
VPNGGPDVDSSAETKSGFGTSTGIDIVARGLGSSTTAGSEGTVESTSVKNVDEVESSTIDVSNDGDCGCSDCTVDETGGTLTDLTGDSAAGEVLAMARVDFRGDETVSTGGRCEGSSLEPRESAFAMLWTTLAVLAAAATRGVDNSVGRRRSSSSNMLDSKLLENDKCCRYNDEASVDAAVAATVAGE